MPPWVPWVVLFAACLITGIIFGFVVRGPKEPEKSVEIPSPELSPKVIAETKKAEQGFVDQQKVIVKEHDATVEKQIEQQKDITSTLLNEEAELNDYLKQVGKNTRS
jgi:hypothetical protein